MMLRNNLMMGMVGSGKLIPPEIGHFWQGQGGFYVGMLKYPTGEVYAILVSDKTAGGHAERLRAGAGTSSSVTAQSVYDGYSNTQNLILSNASYPAASFCVDYRGYGFRDWYLPALSELNLAYRIYKSRGTVNDPANNTDNPYAFPLKFDKFTSTVPPITSHLDWRADGAQTLDNIDPDLGYLWSSRQSGTSTSNSIWMVTGGILSGSRTIFRSVRAFRRVRLKYLE